MFKVYDKESAKLAYKAIKMFEQYKDNAAIKAMIDETKRNLRKWTNRYNRDADGCLHRIVKEYGIDGFVELVSLPDDICNMREVEEYFRDNVYMECAPSMYDCTGKAFTGWYKLFMKHSEGSFYAYHSVCMDV